MSFSLSFDASIKIKKSAIGSFFHHIARDVDLQNGIDFHRSNENIDPTRTHLNKTLVYDKHAQTWVDCSEVHQINDAMNARLAAVKSGLRKDAVVMRPLLMQLDPAWYAEHHDAASINKSGNDMAEWAIRQFGPENIIYIALHLDETNPHFHVGLCPVTPDGRLAQKDWFNGPSSLARMHKDFREFMRAKGYDIAMENLKPGKYARRMDEKEYKDWRQLEDEKKTLEDRSVSMDAAEKVAEKRNLGLNLRENALEKREKEVLEREAELDQREADLVERERRLRNETHGFNQAGAALDERLRQFKAYGEALYQAMQKLEVVLTRAVSGVLDKLAEADLQKPEPEKTLSSAAAGSKLAKRIMGDGLRVMTAEQQQDLERRAAVGDILVAVRDELDRLRRQHDEWSAATDQQLAQSAPESLRDIQGRIYRLNLIVKERLPEVAQLLPEVPEVEDVQIPETIEELVPEPDAAITSSAATAGASTETLEANFNRLISYYSSPEPEPDEEDLEDAAIIESVLAEASECAHGGYDADQLEQNLEQEEER